MRALTTARLLHHPAQLVTTLWLATLVPACAPEDPRGSGLVFDVQGRDLALLRDGEALFRLPAPGIQVGVVERYEPSRSYDPWWEDAIDADWLTSIDAVEVEVEDDAPLIAADLIYPQDITLRLEVQEHSAERYELVLTPSEDGADIAYFRLLAQVEPTQGFYGLGEHFDTPNHKGKRRAMQLEVDLAIESGNNEAHVPVPLLIGTRGWGLFVEDPHPMVFEVAIDAPDLVSTTIGVGPDGPDGLTFHLYSEADPLDITGQYYQTTGPPMLPAPWAYGPVVWRDENRDQQQVEDDLQAMRDLDLPASGIWLDRPYASGVNTFDFDPAKFPDPPAMIAKAHAAGFRVALWHTPYADPIEAPVQHSEAVAGGYFPPQAPPNFTDWSLPIDLTNPAAYGWWQGWIRTYTDLGIEGFKLDYAEEILVGLNGGRLPWSFADGTDERVQHSRFQLQYHKVYAETLPFTGGLLLARSGTYGDQVHTSVIWPGDLDATMDTHGTEHADYTAVGGLPAAVVASMSLGPSGYPFFGSDTGGYRHCPPDAETFTRWFEHTALSTMMQIGTSCNDVAWEPTPGNGFDQALLDTYRAYTRLHLRLFPYVWAYAARLEVDGRPILRPLGLAWPALGVHPGDTYMLGDHLLVAPVIEHGARSRDVTFPPGAWRHWFTGEVVHGPGTRQVAAPLDSLPLFLSEGAIVPMLRPSVDTLATTTDPEVDSALDDPGVLYARIVPGAASELTLHDGTSIAQASGASTRVTAAPGDDYDQGFLIELLLDDPPASIEVDGVTPPEVSDASTLEAASEGWAWDGTALWVRLPDDGGRLVIQ